MSAQSTSTLRYVGNIPTTLADGRPIEPGEYVDLTEDQINDEYNASLMQLNQLIPVDKKQAEDARRAERKEEREAEEEQEQIAEVTQKGGKS